MDPLIIAIIVAVFTLIVLFSGIPIDVPVAIPYTIKTILGGIKTPNVPPAAIVPVAI